MTILKSCVHRPVAKIDDGPRNQRKAVVLHTAVSRSTSLFDFWQGGSAGKGIGSHIYIAKDGHAEQYLDCTVPAHRVLTADLRWTPMGDLRVGDQLIAFDEHGPRRRYVTSTVLHAAPALRPVFDVEMATGQILTVTGDHPWLLRRGGDGALVWRKTRDLVGMSEPFLNSVNGRPRARNGHTERRKWSRAPYLFEPWDEASDYEAGWLAGMFDGDGSLGSHHALTLAQRPGPAMDRVVRLLQNRGKLATVTTVDPRKGDCLTATVTGGLPARLALLGSIRPERLLAKVNPETFGILQVPDSHAVLRVQPAGEQEVTLLQTSTGTFIAEGYPMHNTSRETGHAFAANAFAVGIETWDNADPDHTPWTQAQLDKIIAICQELGVPGKALLEGPSDGVGFHRQFPSWNKNKHSCPGDLRVNQVKTVIIPALQGGDMTQDEFDKMHAKSHEVRVDRLAEVADSALALSDWVEGTEPEDPGRKAIVDKLKALEASGTGVGNEPSPRPDREGAPRRPNGDDRGADRSGGLTNP